MFINFSEYYKNFKNTDKFTSHAPFVQTKTVKQNERIPTLEEMRIRLNLDTLKSNFSNSEFSNVIYNDNIQNQEEIKKRKLELMNGSKNLLKGIYNNTSSSVYQETFKGLPAKYPYSVKHDFSTSAVKGIIPDPITMDRIKENKSINDNLKNTIKTIMFS